ncbi:MAG TPA: hypothetical protein VKV23_06650 [Acidimicrobiales bacterium]|nr:hypothetical protein [Acidimicrobiales bacterium]
MVTSDARELPAGRATLGDTVRLVRRYVLQETVGPLRHLGRLVGLGVAGALLVAVAALFALVGVLRLLQGETGSAFAGSWSFAPYLLTGVVGSLLIGLAVAATLRGARRHGER